MTVTLICNNGDILDVDVNGSRYVPPTFTRVANKTPVFDVLNPKDLTIAKPDDRLFKLDLATGKYFEEA